MQIRFRVDASHRIGTGHVVRCLTLAAILRERGAECVFVHRLHAGHMADVIRKKGFSVRELPAPGPGVIAGENGHADWLGVSIEEDARETAAALENESPDWLIVDHYALDSRWEHRLSPFRRRLMVIDDLADRSHECDLLLDQNWFAEETWTRYEPLVSRQTTLLLGPEFALFKPEYAQLRALMPARDGLVRRVLVFLGGSDPTNQTAKVLEGLTVPDLAHLAVDLVLGVNHPDSKGIEAGVKARPGTSIHKNLPSLAGLMARADLMIGAGGTTTWERMCLGLPSIVMSIAANQTPKNLTLMRAGYIQFIGDMADVQAADISSAVRESLFKQDALKAQSARMQSLVPGTGTLQVAERLLNPAGI